MPTEKGKRQMRGHTPGPWTVDGRAIDSAHFEIAVVSEGVDVDETEMPSDEVEANARIIAAAPVMLTALKRVANFINDNYTTDELPIEFIVVNAIAKAEGRGE